MPALEMKRALVLLALLLAVTGGIADRAAAAGAAPAATERLPGLDHAILVRLNATRVSRGLRPLVLSDELQAAAVAHSRSMLEGGFFAHESRDGSSFVARVKRFYRSSGTDAWSAGENILYDTAELDAGTAIEAWLGSPAHRDNMLAPEWREVGIGSLHASTAGGAFGGEPTWVITMDFGARAGAGKAARPASTPSPGKPKAKPRQTGGTKAKPKAAKPPKPSKPSKPKVERVLPRPAGDDRGGNAAGDTAVPDVPDVDRSAGAPPLEP